VGVKKLGLSKHAIQRFHERVKPALSAKAAAAELRALVDMADLVTDPPEWMQDTRPTDRWLELADGIAAAVAGNTVTTILLRGGADPAARARKQAHKRHRRADRAWRNSLIGNGKLKRGKGHEWA
jgi:hypothetical protein